MSDFMSNNDEISLDFSGVTAISFGPLPSGDYRAKISKVETAVSQAGNRMLKIWFDIMSSMSPIDIPEGKKAYAQINLGEKSLPYAKPFFDAITDTDQPVNFSPAQLVGYDIGLTLGQGSYMKEEQDGSKSERKTNTIEGYFKVS